MALGCRLLCCAPWQGSARGGDGAISQGDLAHRCGILQLKRHYAWSAGLVRAAPTGMRYKATTAMWLLKLCDPLTQSTQDALCVTSAP
jgi:hypothetical protein